MTFHNELSTCTVRTLVAADDASLARHANDERIACWTSDRFPHPYTLEFAREYIVKAASLMSWAIDVDGEVVGGIALMPKEGVHRVGAEIGYWLTPTYWNRGIATDVVDFACRHAFTSLDVLRVEALVLEGNVGSTRVLEKCGFAFEGRHRRACIKGGRVLDELVYARLRDDTRA